MAKKNKITIKESKFTNSAFEQLKDLTPKTENKNTPTKPTAVKAKMSPETYASDLSVEEEKALFLDMMRSLSHRDPNGGKFARKENIAVLSDSRQFSANERDEDVFSREMAVAQVEKINAKHPKMQFAKKKKNTVVQVTRMPQALRIDEHFESQSVESQEEQHTAWFVAEVREKTGIRPLQSKLQKQLNKLSAKNVDSPAADNVDPDKNEENTPHNLFNLAPYKELLKKINKHIEIFGPLPELNLKGLIMHAALRRLEIFVEAMQETRTPYALVLLSSPLSSDEKSEIVQTVKKNSGVKDVVPILESASDFKSVYLSVRF